MEAYWCEYSPCISIDKPLEHTDRMWAYCEQAQG